MMQQLPPPWRRERMQDLYTDVRALAEFAEVNRTGFRKALKKHDKVLGPLRTPHSLIMLLTCLS